MMDRDWVGSGCGGMMIFDEKIENFQFFQFLYLSFQMHQNHRKRSFGDGLRCFNAFFGILWMVEGYDGLRLR